MTTCHTCGEPIQDDDAAQMRAPLTRIDPLELVFQRLNRSGYFSAEDTKTHNIHHGRGRFRTHSPQ